MKQELTIVSSTVQELEITILKNLMKKIGIDTRSVDQKDKRFWTK